jgi:heat shock protein HslJ
MSNATIRWISCISSITGACGGKVDGHAIELGPLGATRKACGDAIDDQEFRFFKLSRRFEASISTKGYCSS